jgi:hypothetical protein
MQREPTLQKLKPPEPRLQKQTLQKQIPHGPQQQEARLRGPTQRKLKPPEPRLQKQMPHGPQQQEARLRGPMQRELKPPEPMPHVPQQPGQLRPHHRQRMRARPQRSGSPTPGRRKKRKEPKRNRANANPASRLMQTVNESSLSRSEQHRFHGCIANAANSSAIAWVTSIDVVQRRGPTAGTARHLPGKRSQQEPDLCTIFDDVGHQFPEVHAAGVTSSKLVLPTRYGIEIKHLTETLGAFFILQALWRRLAD